MNASFLRSSGIPVLTLSLFSLFTVGCSSNSHLDVVNSSLNLKPYRIIYVEKMTAANGVVVPDDVLANSTTKVVASLSNSKVFDAVVTTPSGDVPNVRFTAQVTKYEPGDRAARMMLIGMGTASYKVDVQLCDEKTGEVLARGGIDEFWGWGGLLGGSRGIENMVDSGSEHISENVEHMFVHAYAEK